MYEKYGIFLFDNVFSDDICEKCIKYINDNANFEKYYNPTSNLVGAKEIVLQNNTCHNGLNREIFENLSIIMKDISVKIQYKMGEGIIIINGDVGYHLRKISNITHLHKDGVLNNNDATNFDSREMRVVSIIGAFNDYEGGIIHFPHQDIKIKLKKGQVLAFPPYWTHPHEVSAPENGTVRYTVTTWMVGK